MADLNEVDLGDLVRCDITGFEGIVVARSDYLNGCQRVLVQPRKLGKDDDKIADAVGFDVQQVTILQRQAFKSPAIFNPNDRELVPAHTGGPDRPMA